MSDTTARPASSTPFRPDPALGPATAIARRPLHRTTESLLVTALVLFLIVLKFLPLMGLSLSLRIALSASIAVALVVGARALVDGDVALAVGEGWLYRRRLLGRRGWISLDTITQASGSSWPVSDGQRRVDLRLHATGCRSETFDLTSTAQLRAVGKQLAVQLLARDTVLIHDDAAELLATLAAEPDRSPRPSSTPMHRGFDWNRRR